MISLLSDGIEDIKKRNRQKKLAPRKHKIAHESGRGTKNLWRQIIEKGKTK